MDISGTIVGPVLAKVAAYLKSIAEQDAVTRAVVSKNAPRASYMGNGTLGTNDGTNGTLTASAIVRIVEADLAEVFYQAVIYFPTTAGSARYTINGIKPTAAGNGLPIPSGGYTLTITGHDNIKSFQMIAETGQTAAFVYQLFK